MSTLSVHDLQGFSTYGNKVRVPSGHTISVEGALQLPSWTSSTRPSSPENGLIGFNTQSKRLELYYSGLWINVGSTSVGLAKESPATSAKEILEINSLSSDGLYWIKPGGYSGEAFLVYCDMSTDGGGWMHCGTITDNNEPVNNANHVWGNPLNPPQDTGIWEDNSTYGTQSFESDFKSQAWNSSPFTQFLIKDQGDALRNLFYTNTGQISTNNASFSTFWGSLSWDANGSETSSACYNAGRVRGVGITNFGVVDPVLESGNKSIILLKWGERDGAQDGNKDRTMIAWHRHDAADNVDAPNGLGCFTNRSGTLDRRDICPTANRQDYPPNSIAGAPFNYTLWIR